MDLKAFWNTLTRIEREDMAREIGTSPAYLYQVGHGIRRASPSLSRKIETVTEGAVTKEDLRPDLWEAA